MEIVHAAFFLLLACISFEKAHAEPCSSDDIQPCLQAMGDLSQLANSGGNGADMTETMTNLCRGITCIEQLTCEPSSESTAQVQPIMDQYRSYCQGAGTGPGPGAGAGNCQMSDLQKCVTVGSQMGAMGSTDINAMCSAMDDMEKCYSDLLPHCEGGIKNAVEQAFNQMKMQRKQMPCSGQGCNITECNSMLIALESHQKGPSEFCKTTRNAVECYTKEKPNCPENSQIDTFLKEMGPYSSKGCCDVLAKIHIECVEGKEHLSNDTIFEANESECLKLEDIFHCIDDNVPNCTESLMKKMETSKNMIKNNIQSCEMSGFATNDGVRTLVPSIAVLASALVASFFTF